MQKFKVININPPGRVNVLLQGKFRDVNLYDLNDTQLQELYEAKSKYVTLNSKISKAEAPKIEVKNIEPLKKNKKGKK
jgi:hypothetical protein